MSFKAPGSNRREGSNVLALAMSVVLIAFAAFVLIAGRNPLESVPYHVVVGFSSLVFGLVLLVWVRSDWNKWIGNETVNMVVGVVAALITISAFAQQIDKTSDRVAGDAAGSPSGRIPN
ncbi:MAG TPA: rhomboid family intramembrane serine protease [Acetobacteraceae bacterium]|jgi:hypothetical protein|nr:rhomboid family intramembrane serine protease [Acetobacteraceae bacterium]